jgi:hypothetical protein
MADPVTLDWRKLVDEPELHSCGCDHCPVNGNFEPTFWPTLVATSVDLISHVTDRWMAVRTELAPIPDGYEGEVQDGPPLRAAFFRAQITDMSPTGLRFRPATLKALELTGWRLRLAEHAADASPATTRACAIIDAEGRPIGWAMSQRGDGALYEEPR